MRFLVDARSCLPRSRSLVGVGHDASHVADHGMVDASDGAIWDYALSVHAAIVTKDEDFAARKFRSPGGPPVVWVRLPNLKRGQLVARFEMMLPLVVRALESGETLVEAI